MKRLVLGIVLGIMIASLHACSSNGSADPSPTLPSESIAFSSCDESGVSQIVLADTDGGNPRTITQGTLPRTGFINASA